LAAWFRVKYEHIVLGALAASAPVKMLHSDEFGFNQIIYKDFSCSADIKQALEEFYSRKDYDAMSKELGLCDSDALTDDNKNTFLATLESIFSYAAMVNYP